MAAELKHKVAIVIAGQTLTDWLSYDIKTSLIQPAGSFNFTLPWSLALYKLCRNDAKVTVTIDGAPIMTGYTTRRLRRASARSIQISGFDKVTKLIRESAPTVDFSGIKASQLIQRVSSPWFDEVELSNTRNRDVVRGRRGHKVRDSGRVFIDQRKGVGSKIEPGQYRFTVITEIAKQMDAVVWSSGDGRTLIIGQPDFKQEVQFRFLHPKHGSRRMKDPAVVMDLELDDTTDDRYSHYLFLGAGAGTDANYGHSVSSRWGEAKDNPDTEFGEGKDFTRPLRLVIADRHDLSSRKEATAEAKHEQTRRDVKRHTARVEFAGHGQVVAAGAGRTLFALDTVCDLEDEEAEVRGRYVIVDCNYRCASREAAETTALELLPTGTRLAM